MSEPAEGLPPAAAIVSHTVADWDRRKQAFDDHEDARRGAGALGHHLNRSEDDPNHVTVYVAVADLDAAKAFTTSDELRAAMEQSGVIGQPEITWVTPMREAVVWDRELPAMVITHRVNDFDSWLEGYNAADDLRAGRGIVGHAANRSLDDPSVESSTTRPSRSRRSGRSSRTPTFRTRWPRPESPPSPRSPFTPEGGRSSTTDASARG